MIAGNIGVFAVITLAMGIPASIACILVVQEFGWPELTGTPDPIVSILLTSLIFALDWAFNGGVLAYLTLTSLHGRPASLRQCVVEAVQAFRRNVAILLPFVIVMQFMNASLDTVEGILFFLLSALCATLCWLVPACIVWERADGGFWRNLNLVQGNFLRIFAIVAMFFIAQLAAHRISMFFAGPFLDTTTASGWYGAVGIMYTIIWLFGRITDVASAVSYFLIRTDVEGPPANDLAKVFD